MHSTNLHPCAILQVYTGQLVLHVVILVVMLVLVSLYMWLLFLPFLKHTITGKCGRLCGYAGAGQPVRTAATLAIPHRTLLQWSCIWKANATSRRARTPMCAHALDCPACTSVNSHNVAKPLGQLLGRPADCPAPARNCQQCPQCVAELLGRPAGCPAPARNCQQCVAELLGRPADCPAPARNCQQCPQCVAELLGRPADCPACNCPQSRTAWLSC